MHSSAARSPRASNRRAYPPFAHQRPGLASVLLASAAPIVTFLLWLWFVVDTFRRHQAPTVGQAVWLTVMVIAATALAFSSSMYLMGRFGALARLREHRRATRQ